MSASVKRRVYNERTKLAHEKRAQSSRGKKKSPVNYYDRQIIRYNGRDPK